MGRVFAKFATEAVSVVTRLRVPRRGPVLALALALALPGCGTAIQYATDATGGSATLGDAITDLSDVSDDGAQDQCTLYDTSSPNRSTCIACYDSLVSTYCPGQSAIGDCVDTEFQEQFPDRLNQCILNSIVAGFTCSITCDDDEDLDESTCSCITRATQSTGLSAISLIDVGQYDSGPPVVTAYASSSALSQRVSYLDACDFTSTEGSSVFLSVRNRGGTMFRDNTYSVLSSYPADGVDESFSPAAALASAWQGLNAYLNFSLTIGNSSSGDLITDEYSGEAGSLERLAGQPFEVTGIDPSPTPSPLPSVTPDSGDSFSGVEMTNPSAVTRDIHGNVYFAENWLIPDDQRSSIWVLCLTSGFWCTSDDVGQALPIAGHGTGTSTYRDNDDQDREDAQIQMITALRVDVTGNVYFAEYGRFSTDSDGDGLGNNPARDAVVSVVCRTTGSGFCSGKGWTAEAVYAIAGYSNGLTGAAYYDSDWVDSGVPDHWIVGFDLEADDADINLYVARRSIDTGMGTTTTYGTLWAYCGFASAAMGPCAEEGVGNGVEIVGSTKYFSDVVATQMGNLLLVSPTSGRLSVYCRDVSGDDGVCGLTGLTASASTGLKEITEDESGDSSDPDPVENSDPGSGTSIATTNLVAPAAILTSRRYAGEFGSPSDFNDLNFVIASLHRRTDSARNYAAGGNTLRVFCLEARGWCRDLEVGKSYILAGVPGRSGTGGSAASSGTSVAFGNINGVTYDTFKNLVFSSSYPPYTPTTDPSNPSYHEDIDAFDNSIYRLKLRNETDRFGAKYVFTDSNAQSSYYCLALKARVECGLEYWDSDGDGTEEYASACTCTLVPSNGSPEGYWRGTTSTADCQ